jgi:hypothetical protein
MNTIHNLVDSREEIYRQVNNTDDGISTTTWSDNPQVSAWIAQHVAEMKALVESQNGGIRWWDDLFAKVFEMREYVHLEYEAREDGKGVVVKQRGDNACGTALVQAHAQVVSAFVKRGHDEMQKNHDVPAVCFSDDAWLVEPSTSEEEEEEEEADNETQNDADANETDINEDDEEVVDAAEEKPVEAIEEDVEDDVEDDTPGVDIVVEEEIVKEDLLEPVTDEEVKEEWEDARQMVIEGEADAIQTALSYSGVRGGKLLHLSTASLVSGLAVALVWSCM